MFHSFLSKLRIRSSDEQQDTRRRYPRREVDRCAAVICGQTFPVEDWSFGGLLLTADDRLFSVGQTTEITVRFRLRSTVMDVTHMGTIVRKGPQKVAVEFEPLTAAIRRAFQLVVDDYVAREFANSQAV